MGKYPLLLNQKCKNCNGDIFAKRSRDMTNVFCGTGCVGKFLKAKEPEFVSCLQCKNLFKKTCKTKNMYCSKKCCGQSKVITYMRVCNWCGDLFKLKNIADERRGKSRYCSKECGSKTYDWDESYFEEIDTEQKAYWLGFIYADGCLSKDEFRLHLSIKDVEHLKTLSRHLKSNHPIHYCKDDTVSFNIGNKKISSDLEKLGVVRRKTFIIEYPNLSNYLNRHFIRGFSMVMVLYMLVNIQKFGPYIPLPLNLKNN